MSVRLIASPLGLLRAEATSKGICRLDFLNEEIASKNAPTDSEQLEGLDLLNQLERELAEYFSGARRVFDVPLDATGTPFQHQVWAQLRCIPYGATASYAEIASRVRTPRHTRAVAMACARNPISILVPCHRVIGSRGHLTGYAGGLPRKQALLDLEGGRYFTSLPR